MATLVGETPWRNPDAAGAWDLPAGTVKGDRIIYVLSGLMLRGVPYIGRVYYTDTVYQVIRYGYAYHLEHTGVQPVPDTYAKDWGRRLKIIVMRGTSGIGAIRNNYLQVPVKALGGAVFITSDNTPPADLTWSEPDGGFKPGLRTSIIANSPSDATIGVTGGGIRPGSLSFELLPPETPVVVPVLPEDTSDVSSSGISKFEWVFQNGSSQDAYQLRVAGLYYRASDGTWQAGETTNPGSASSVLVDTASFTPNAPVGWTVRARDAVTGIWSPWSPTRTVTPVTPPTVSNVAVEAPGGDLTPTVTWSTSTPRGEQTAFEVRVARLGTIIYESGVQAGKAKSYTVPILDWVNGGSYSAEVRIQQTGGSWSGWATKTFTISWTPPTNPSIAATASTEGISLAITAGVGDSIDVQQLGTDGIWRPLISYVSKAAVTSFLDPFAPFRMPTRYRVQASKMVESQKLSTDWILSPTSPISLSRRSVLASARDPLRTWAWAPLMDDDVLMVPVQNIGMYDGIGSTKPFGVYGPVRGKAGTASVLVLSSDQRKLVEELLTSGETLVYRYTPHDNLETNTTGNSETIYLLVAAPQEQGAVTDDLSEGRAIKFAFRTTPPVPLGYTEATITRPIP